MTLPEVTHIYQNHTFDSTRWRNFVPRDDEKTAIKVLTPTVNAG
jgi:hypothetical protein